MLNTVVDQRVEQEGGAEQRCGDWVLLGAQGEAGESEQSDGPERVVVAAFAEWREPEQEHPLGGEFGEAGGVGGDPVQSPGEEHGVVKAPPLRREFP